MVQSFFSSFNFLLLTFITTNAVFSHGIATPSRTIAESKTVSTIQDLEITPFPQPSPGRRLHRRQAASSDVRDTCGYVNGRPESIIQCAESLTCASAQSQDPNSWGCCRGNGSDPGCQYYNVCSDSILHTNSLLGGTSITFLTSCPQNVSQCALLSLDSFTNFWCVPRTEGVSHVTLPLLRTTDLNFAPPTTAGTSITSIIGTSTSSAGKGHGGAHLDAGDIAGIAVGIAGLITLVGSVVWFCLRRGKISRPVQARGLHQEIVQNVDHLKAAGTGATRAQQISMQRIGSRPARTDASVPVTSSESLTPSAPPVSAATRGQSAESDPAVRPDRKAPLSKSPQLPAAPPALAPTSIVTQEVPPAASGSTQDMEDSFTIPERSQPSSSPQRLPPMSPQVSGAAGVTAPILPNPTALSAGDGPPAEAFKVAIFYAVKVEGDSIMYALDERWRTNTQDALDQNAYTRGRIGKHNVILVSLPGSGQTTAAAAALEARRSFPNINLGLVVGVCGGVPIPKAGEPQIFLADLILSNSFVSIGYGRQRDDGLQRCKRDSKPHIILRSLFAKLQLNIHLDEARDQLVQHMVDIDGRRTAWYEQTGNPGAATSLLQEPRQDQLFVPQYIHKHHDGHCAECRRAANKTCDTVLEKSCTELRCDKAHLVARDRPRDRTDKLGRLRPHIHIGTVGSSDILMRSALIRDEVASPDNLIAFEMEGVGILDHLPTIVVKAVSDYADSHKNKSWQPLAADVAAAGAKAVLSNWN